MVLSSYQRETLRSHVYKTEGCSLIESLLLNHFWSWLTTKFPLWLAPNTITFIGFISTLLATLCVVLNDLNCEGTWWLRNMVTGSLVLSVTALLCCSELIVRRQSTGLSKAPRWTYLLCAIGIFIYQTLDGCDGKQARRTGMSSPLGELFDHGCDVYATFLYALAFACVPGLIHYPYLMFTLVVLVIQLNYTYHWQTFVCGILFFKKVSYSLIQGLGNRHRKTSPTKLQIFWIDIGEALISQMCGCLISFFFGPEVWQYHVLAFLGIHYPMNLLVALGTLFFSVINLLSAYHICLTRGVGKNGSTLAGTSVVSPIITPLVIIGFACFYGYHSPSSIHLHHCILFMTAFFFPMSKGVVNIMIAGMTKTPFPLLDTIMLGPLLACLNVYFSTPLPEFYLLLAVALYNTYDVTVLLIELCVDFCDVLGVSVFTVPKEKLEELQAKDRIK